MTGNLQAESKSREKTSERACEIHCKGRRSIRKRQSIQMREHGDADVGTDEDEESVKSREGRSQRRF
jgi:hypothetical protein